jgi:hypothetical protein
MPIAGSSRIAALLLVPAVACAQADAPAAVTPQSAAPAASAASAAAASAAAPANEAADAARRSVRAMANWLARGVDSWFGDRPFADGGKVTDGRFSVGLLKRQRETTDVDVRFNASFRLPNIEEQTYIFLGRDDPRDVITDKPGPVSRKALLLARENAERAFFAGIGRSISDSIDFRLGFRGGLKPYAQGRYKTQWEIGEEGLVELRQTLFWSLADRAGSTTAVSYEHLLSPVVATRWLNSATITQTSRRFEWSSLLGLYRSFGQQRLLSLEALVNGRQGSGVAATDYGLQTRWEQPVYRDWLVGGIVIGHFWPRPDASTERRGAWAAGVNLLMRF